jgi:hypothetical protein
VRRPLLAATAPRWFEVTRETTTYIEGVARIPRTRWAEKGLAVSVRGSRPVVRETVPGTELPLWCLERHIFGDAQFCMGLSTPAIRSRFLAERWWDQFAQFLVCQSVASETGLWPLMNGLDHGDAGHLHNRALDLAERLEILDEYLAIQAGYAREFSAETSNRLGDDPGFAALQELEARRHAAKAANDIAAARSSRSCCGTMRDCPYRPELKITLAGVPVSQTRRGDLERAALLGTVSALAIASSMIAGVDGSLHLEPFSGIRLVR